ncbi:MAG: ABC transporter permease [Armatimonadetes bacterium]|nr:ABC transporter permease [Armatimonadota bacterium]
MATGYGRRLLKLYAYLLGAMMVLPIVITLPVAVTTTRYMTFPPQGFTLRWFGGAFEDRILVESLLRSINLAAVSSALAVAVGLLASFGVERHAFRGKDLVESMFAGPQMVPQIILVLGLLIAYEKMRLADTSLGLVLSHVIITLPFAFRTLLASVASLDKRLEWSAQILGANPFRTFVRVIVPQIKTGMFAAFLFSFMVSFSNVTMALFLAAAGKKTLPVEMFNRLQVGYISPAIPALAFILALAGIGVFVIADRTVGVYKILGGGGQ